MKTSGFDKKIQEANRIYEQKREFHGQEKPAAYNLLLSNYRGAVSKILSVAQKSKEKKIINTDPYFALIYDTEKKIYHVLSMRTARDYPNQNYKNRISPAIERKCIHKRIKYRSTILLNKCLEDIRMYAEKIGELNQEYIALENKDGETSTLEDVLAENLYHVSFLPLNTPLDGGRVEKSIELKTADIASITWLNSNPKVGKSLDKVCEGLLQEAGSNGLSKVGFAVSENEYGSGGNTAQHNELKTAIQEFIGTYTSSGAYYKEKKRKLAEMKKEINDPHKEIASQYGLPYMTEDLAHLVESVIVELLNTRGVEANVNIGQKKSYTGGGYEFDPSFGSWEQEFPPPIVPRLAAARHQENPTYDEVEVPF